MKLPLNWNDRKVLVTIGTATLVSNWYSTTIYLAGFPSCPFG